MRLLLISSSVVHGYGYLEHDQAHLRRFLGDRKRMVVVPFAQPDHAAVTARVAGFFGRFGCEVTQVREPRDLDGVEAIFTSGGNTFRLLKALYERNLLDAIRERVRDGGVHYIGSSAGSNVTAPTIKTTNDMPIVYPPSFDALGFVPFQINPHYLDPDPGSTHKGETREERLLDYLQDNEIPVVGLREGSTLLVEDQSVTLLGSKTARMFRRGAEPEEQSPGLLSL